MNCNMPRRNQDPQTFCQAPDPTVSAACTMATIPHLDFLLLHIAKRHGRLTLLRDTSQGCSRHVRLNATQLGLDLCTSSLPSTRADRTGRHNMQTEQSRHNMQTEQADRKSRWSKAQARQRAYLGTKLHIRQEEVNAVEDFTAALPNAMEAQPAHCDYGSITAGCGAGVLLIAHLQRYLQC